METMQQRKSIIQKKKQKQMELIYKEIGPMNMVPLKKQ